MKCPAPLFDGFPLINLTNPGEELSEAELTPAKTNLPHSVVLDCDWSKGNGAE